MNVLAVCLLAVVLATASRAEDDVQVTVNGEDSVATGVKVLLRLYDDCTSKSDGLTSCFKLKALTFMDRISRAQDLPITDVLTLVKTPAGLKEKEGRALNENELEATLPRASEAREDRLDQLLFDRVARFFRNHKLQVNFPDLESEQLQKGVEEGRGKMKKMMGSLMMGLAMKLAAIIPIAIGGLFLLAGKALIISKIALVLSLIIALKKLLSQKDSGHHDHGWQSGGGGGWDRRSIEAQEQAQRLAYRGQAQTNSISS